MSDAYSTTLIWSLICSAMHDMIIVAAYPSLHISFSNPAAVNILNYSQQQLQQFTLPDLFPPYYNSHLVGTLDTLVHRSPVREQEIMLTREGTPIAVETQYSLIQPNEYTPLSILCVAREIVQRPVSEQPHGHQINFLNQKIIDAAPIGIFSYDRMGRVTMINRTHMRINHIPDDAPLEQFIGMPILEHNSTIVANGLKEHLQQVLEGQPFDIECPAFITRTKHEISVRVQGVPLNDALGTIIGGLIMVEDITARVASEKRLQQSEARYRWLIKALPDLLLRIDEDCRVLDYEESSVKLYNKPEMFLSHTIEEVMPPDLAGRMKETLRQTLATNTIQTIEFQFPLGSETHHYEARVAPIDAHEVLFVVRDITEQKQAERELVESEKRFRSLAEALPDLIFHLDHQGTYLEFHVPKNGGYFEPEREQLIGKTIAEIIPPDAANAALPAFYEAVRTGLPTKADYSILEPSGQRYYECRFNPTANQEMIAVVRDITDRTRQERLLEHIAQATQQLLVANELDPTTVASALELLGSTLDATCVFLFEGTSLAQDDTPALSLLGAWTDRTDFDSAAFEDNREPHPWPASILPWHDELTQGAAIRQTLILPPHDALALLTGLDTLSVLMVPIFADKAWWGMLLFADRQTSRKWTSGDESALNTMAASIGGVIRRNRIEENLRDARKKADTLREVGNTITAKHNLPEIFTHLLDQIRNIVDFDTANVMMFEQDHARVVAHVGYDKFGMDHDFITNLKLPIHSFHLIKRMFDTRKPVICADVPNNPDWVVVQNMDWIKSWIGVPIILNGNKVIGLFSLDSTRLDTYNDERLLSMVIAIAQQAAIAVKNAQYYEQIQRYNNELFTLQRAGRAILSDLKLDEMLLRLAQEMTYIVDVTHVIICRSGPEAQTGIVETSYQAAGTYSNAAPIAPRATIDVTHSQIQTAFRQGTSQILTDTDLPDVFPAVPLLAQARWLVIVPLRSNDQIRGFVLLCNHNPGYTFQLEQITICEALADQVAIMLEQARLFQDIHALERTKTRMINMASHDLRGPLTRVVNSLNTLADDPARLSGEQQNALESAQCAINDLETMMRKLLSLKRIEDQHKAAEPIIWSEIITNSIASQNAELLARNQTLMLDIVPNLPITYGDPVQLTHALANLIQNAIKFTPPHGEIKVQGYIKDYGGKACVAVEVKDTGDGIPSAMQEDLFTPFYRAQHENSPDVPGTGLGLWIVKATIEDHHGRVYFDSVPKQGSLFGFWVPVD